MLLPFGLKANGNGGGWGGGELCCYSAVALRYPPECAPDQEPAGWSFPLRWLSSHSVVDGALLGLIPFPFEPSLALKLRRLTKAVKIFPRATYDGKLEIPSSYETDFRSEGMITLA